ncbi:hypothetical protein SELMODRAFT_406933 [Selaginella moellendorffii]|uniref:Uncharacterized protein n=1 Tax=Selaginella moellendorffii TaxID=88036 RepID=D8R3E1_SELML|nr:hypothetical protein SELMODRAFT_406933 [Selaginella moellendorffii]
MATRGLGKFAFLWYFILRMGIDEPNSVLILESGWLIWESCVRIIDIKQYPFNAIVADVDEYDALVLSWKQRAERLPEEHKSAIFRRVSAANMVYDWFGGIPRSGTGKVKQLTEENIGQDVAIALGNTKLQHIDVDAILPKHSSFQRCTWFSKFHFTFCLENVAVLQCRPAPVLRGIRDGHGRAAGARTRRNPYVQLGGNADRYLWRPLRKNNADFDFVLAPQTLGKITHDPPSLEYLAKALRAREEEFGKKVLDVLLFLIPSENFSQLGFQHYRTSRKQQSNENVDLFQDIC